MSEEQDSWFKGAFGVDLGKAVDKIEDEVSGAASTSRRSRPVSASSIIPSPTAGSTPAARPSARSLPRDGSGARGTPAGPVRACHRQALAQAALVRTRLRRHLGSAEADDRGTRD